MIEWLVQSNAAHPALSRGLPPDGLLSESELRRFESLRAEKRRRDWLLGRWTAKQLLRAYVEQRTAALVPLDTLIVESDPDGAPRIEIGDWRLEIGRPAFNLQSLIANLQLSISHCDGLAFCAISDGAGVQIGADIEKVEPRGPGFANDYFTAEELVQLRTATLDRRDTVTTLIWSAKEAALKALRLGLTVDTRAVACTLGTPAPYEIGWAPLAVYCDPLLLGRRVDGLSGWWRVVDGYVLTLALMQPERHGIRAPLQTAMAY